MFDRGGGRFILIIMARHLYRGRHLVQAVWLNINCAIVSLFLFYRASEAGSEFSLFEALRDSIYSEVATLISLNESRPHFLVRHCVHLYESCVEESGFNHIIASSKVL